MVVAIFCNSSKLVNELMSNLELERVSKSLREDGLKVALVNQSLARCELVPFRVNGVKVCSSNS
jgi:hypothetical protein